MEHPIQKIRGFNFLGLLGILGLILVSIISFMAVKYVGFITSLLGIYCLIMISFIKFPVILIFKERFELIRMGMNNLFITKQVFEYDDILDIKFVNGYFNWIFIILIPIFWIFLWLFKINLPYYKPDSIILTTKNGKIEITEFGRKKNLLKVFEIIKAKKMPCN